MSTERSKQEWYDATLDDSWAVELFDEMLDEAYETVTMGSFEWTPSRVLAALDPIAYRCGFNDFTDSMAQDAPDEDDEDDEAREAHCGSCREWHETASRWCPDCGTLLDDMEGQGDD